MSRICTLAQLDHALAQGTFLLFVRSLLGELGHAAFAEYESWAARELQTATGWIDADADPEIAASAFARTGVQDSRPKAMFLRRGRPSWTAGENGITQASLHSAFGWPLPAT
ncbi:MAG TPA: hypothetical protein VF530_21220 [Planctomycetota bacterium]